MPIPLVLTSPNSPVSSILVPRASRPGAKWPSKNGGSGNEDARFQNAKMLQISLSHDDEYPPFLGGI
jgi:hypothetical protein